jgi:ABC-type Mn2+/Zn2+ transport system permease subunit
MAAATHCSFLNMRHTSMFAQALASASLATLAISNTKLNTMITSSPQSG